MTIILNCVICNNEIKAKPCFIKLGRGKTCSILCRNKYARSKQDVSGYKNPAWKGGVSFDNKNYKHLRHDWLLKNPGAKEAHHAVEAAIKSGKLIRKNCESCGSDKDIHAHHDNYENKLDVTWLCRKCHKKKHQLVGT